MGMWEPTFVNNQQLASLNATWRSQLRGRQVDANGVAYGGDWRVEIVDKATEQRVLASAIRDDLGDAFAAAITQAEKEHGSPIARPIDPEARAAALEAQLADLSGKVEELQQLKTQTKPSEPGKTQSKAKPAAV